MKKKKYESLMDALGMPEPKIDGIVDGFREAAKAGSDTWESTLAVLKHAMDTPDLVEREARHKLLAYLFVQGEVAKHEAASALIATGQMLEVIAGKLHGGRCDCPKCRARRGEKTESTTRTLDLRTLEGMDDEAATVLRHALSEMENDEDADVERMEAIKDALERYEAKRAGGHE